MAEAVALLRWLAADKFTFLGSRDYKYARDAGRQLQAGRAGNSRAHSCLGVLRDLDRYVLRTSAPSRWC